MRSSSNSCVKQGETCNTKDEKGKRNCGCSQKRARLFVIGTGPGNADHISKRAIDLLKEADAIAGYTTYIDLNMSMTVVFMTVIGGTGHFLGPVLGATFYIIFQNWISSMTQHWWIWMGLVFVAIVYFEGGGLINLFKKERIARLMNRWSK